jgi:hypothetical protein
VNARGSFCTCSTTYLHCDIAADAYWYRGRLVHAGGGVNGGGGAATATATAASDIVTVTDVIIDEIVAFANTTVIVATIVVTNAGFGVAVCVDVRGCVKSENLEINPQQLQHKNLRARESEHTCCGRAQLLHF